MCNFVYFFTTNLFVLFAICIICSTSYLQVFAIHVFQTPRDWELLFIIAIQAGKCFENVDVFCLKFFEALLRASLCLFHKILGHFVKMRINKGLLFLNLSSYVSFTFFIIPMLTVGTNSSLERAHKM